MKKRNGKKEIDPKKIKEKIATLDNYILFLLKNECYPEKNSELGNKYNYINRNRDKCPSIITEKLERIDVLKTEMKIKKDTAHIDRRLNELELFLTDKHRFPRQTENEKSLGQFLENFPDFSSANDAQKARYNDMITKLHDYMLDKLLQYKEENKQDSIIAMDKEHKEWLKHIKFQFTKGKLNLEQNMKYEKLNIEDIEHESVEVRTEKLLRSFVEFVEKNNRLPERDGATDYERNLAINIERYVSGRNESYIFNEEQKKIVEDINKKFRRNRGGVSIPELIYSVAFGYLFKEKYKVFDRNRYHYTVNCDFFMVIEHKEYAFFYDGVKFHKDKINDDKFNTEKILMNGVTVFRVRESALKSLCINNPLYHEYTASNKEKDRKEIINAMANVVIPNAYSGKIEEMWHKICDEARRLKYNKNTEANIICDYISESYKNNKAPSDKKDTSVEEKRLYRRLKQYLERSEMSNLGELIIFCVDAVYAKNPRRTIPAMLKNNGLDEDVLEKIEKFLANDL